MSTPTSFILITKDQTECPQCGGELKHYDYVKRILKTKRGEKQLILVERRYCKQCRKVHRVIDEDVVPYKHYEREVIEGVREGLISEETLGFEDYPSERQMKRWRREENTSLVEREV